jgi:hypothetical protein
MSIARTMYQKRFRKIYWTYQMIENVRTILRVFVLPFSNAFTRARGFRTSWFIVLFVIFISTRNAM